MGWLYGAAFLRLAARILRIEARETSATVILLAGMIAMTTLAAGLSLALPLDWRAFSILILGAAAIFLSGSRQGWLKLSRPRLPRLTGWDAAAGAVLLLAPDYPLHATFPCSLENGMVLCAGEESYTQCYYQPFPCIPKPIEGVEMRGTDWGDGFRSVSGR